MEVGLRILAFMIDCPLCLFSIPLVVISTGWVLERSGPFAWLLIPLWFALFIASPFIYFGVSTGLWGRTPGKWICRLKVVSQDDEPPGLWRGLGRETLKLLAVGSASARCFAFFKYSIRGQRGTINFAALTSHSRHGFGLRRHNGIFGSITNIPGSDATAPLRRGVE